MRLTQSILLSLAVLVISINNSTAQQTYYDVIPGNGNGIRFWQNDLWKMHMGNLPEYQYGPVWDYRIKTNMDATVGRGWTWGASGQTPVAAISNGGTMQIAGKFKLVNNHEIEFGIGVTKQLDAGKIAYQQFSDGLDIVGAGTTGSNRKIKFWNEGGASFNGNVGIGNSSPQMNLDISTSGSYQGIQLDHNSGRWTRLYSSLLNGSFNGITVQNDAGIIFGNNGGNINSGFVIAPHQGTTSGLRIDQNGNVGIGTASPNQKLTVSGTIYGKEVKVDLNVPGPDYVFEKDYALPSLESIQSYIDQNKHLPEVPSAKEMEENGINLSEINMLLLKKVEELTLYVIEQNKSLMLQRNEVEALRQEIKSLKK